MMLGARRARRAARMYYLDCVPIDKIAQELNCSRKEVLEVIDDPGCQQQYLDEAAKARKRLRIRAAAAADAALERQVEFIAQEQTEKELIVAQQRTAARIMEAGMDDGESDGTIKIVFKYGMPELGMPPAGNYREGSYEYPAAGTSCVCIDGGAE